MVEAKVTGLPDFKAALLALPDKLRRRALRNALAAGARVVRDTAKAKTPVLQEPTRRRKAGTVRDAIRVRTSKRDRLAGDVGVFVNVRPIRGSKVKRIKGYTRNGRLITAGYSAISGSGASNPDDPFYWKFLEFGWNPASNLTGGARGKLGKLKRRQMNKNIDDKIRGGFRFLEAGSKRLSEALAIFSAKLRPAIDKLNKGQTP